MKKYVNILIGIAVLLLVLYGGQSLVGERPEAEVTEVETQVGMMSVSGQVTRVSEGDNVIQYLFDIPETATTSIDMEGALVRVTDADGAFVSMYFSYEGGRGYSPMDYINSKIAPHVSVINPTRVSTIGGYDWQGAESESSEWQVASVLGGKWLVVVENRKAAHDAALRVIESLSVE